MRCGVFQRICEVLREHLFVCFRVPSSPCVMGWHAWVLRELRMDVFFFVWTHPTNRLSLS